MEISTKYMVLKEIRGRALEGGQEKYVFAPPLIPGQAEALVNYKTNCVNCDLRHSWITIGNNQLYQLCFLGQ